MKTIITHSGSFHADDVFAAAAVLLAFPDEKFEIIRTRDPEKIMQGEIVMDVGRIYDPEKDRFDHHQQGGAGKRENGIPYASVGLVWKKYGEKICSKEAADRIDKGLISFIDAGDNGVDLFENKTDVAEYSVSRMAAAFNKTTLEEADNDQNFLEIVQIAKRLILREVASAREFFVGKEEIEEAYRNSKDKRLVVLGTKFDKVIIGEVLEKYPEVLYALHPYDEVGFTIRAIRKNSSSFESRKPLPESWAGKSNEELQKITGVPDAVFCHNARFIANAKTKEGALKLAEQALNS